MLAKQFSALAWVACCGWRTSSSLDGTTSDSGQAFAPHQNDLVDLIGKSAEYLKPFFACRPLALVRLDVPSFSFATNPSYSTHPVDAFHLGKRGVEQLAKDGQLPKITGITNKVLFDRVDLDAYVERIKAVS